MLAQHGALHIVKHKTNVIISLTYIDQKVIGARGKLYLERSRTKTRMLNQQWVLIVHSTKALFASFYSCVPLTQSIFWRKTWMMPGHKLCVLLCVLWACTKHYDANTKRHNMPPSVWYMHYTPKACILHTKYVSGHHQTHLDQPIGQLGKRKQTILLLAAIRTHC
jgi:hypothetical protein